MSLQFIIEEPYFSPVEILETHDIQIIKEEYDRQTRFPKVRFKAILQEADVVNRNRRKYPREVLQEVVDYFNNQIKLKRGIPGELNHPLVEGELAKQRMARIDLDNIAVIYKKFDFDGKYVIAEAVTASTRKGVDLYGLIVEDGYNVGFSLRALGSVKPIYEENGQKILIVEKIHRPVTYDVVDNPSHVSAKIIDLSESELLNAKSDSNDVITENETIYLTFGAYKISDEVRSYAKYDNDLKELIESIIENSVEISIDDEVVRVCKDDKCVILSIEKLADDIIDKYFPPENLRTAELFPAYTIPCKRLLLNTSELFGPKKFEFIPYLVNKLINPEQQFLINSRAFSQTNKLIEETQFLINSALSSINDTDEFITFNIESDDDSYIFEEIESISEYEQLLESIDYNELDLLIDYYLRNNEYEKINELLDLKTIDEEIDFYLSNLDDIIDKNKVLLKIEQTASDLITDDTL